MPPTTDPDDPFGPSPLTLYVVEVPTRTGRVCETYPIYEEARRRVEQFPPETLRGMPLIFQELTDGSQRLVREDGKPLQWHRLPDDRPHDPRDDEAIPLTDDLPAPAEPGRPVISHARPAPEQEPDDEPPLSLAEPGEAPQPP